MNSVTPQTDILDQELLGRATHRKNRIFLILLLTFVGAVFSFSFVHLMKETGGSIPVRTQQTELQGGKS